MGIGLGTIANRRQQVCQHYWSATQFPNSHWTKPAPGPVNTSPSGREYATCFCPSILYDRPCPSCNVTFHSHLGHECIDCSHQLFVCTIGFLSGRIWDRHAAWIFQSGSPPPWSSTSQLTDSIYEWVLQSAFFSRHLLWLAYSLLPLRRRSWVEGRRLVQMRYTRPCANSYWSDARAY